VIAVLGALGAIGASAITVMSCEPDHNRDVPGSPRIISAYVNDLKNPPSTSSPQINGGSCDGTDPRFFGGNFQVHDMTDPNKAYNVRCIPDLLAAMPDPNVCGPMCGDQGPFSYAIQVRVVFSEGLNGDAIEDQDNVKLIAKLHPNVVSTMATSPMPVPINIGPLMSGEYTSYYDPAGADFKQGIYGTAPPGPSIVVTPGDGATTVFGLPSGSTTKICFDPAQVKDTVGNGLDISKDGGCVSVPVKALSMDTVPGDASGTPDGVQLTDLASGIAVTFTAPVATTDAQTGAWLEVSAKLATGACVPGTAATTCVVPAACFTVAGQNDPMDLTLPSADTLVVLVTPSDTCFGPLANLPAAAFPVDVAVTAKAGTIADQYGVQLGAAATHHFQILAPSGNPDGGADAAAP
jgi:hypothetical protein